MLDLGNFEIIKSFRNRNLHKKNKKTKNENENNNFFHHCHCRRSLGDHTPHKKGVFPFTHGASSMHRVRYRFSSMRLLLTQVGGRPLFKNFSLFAVIMKLYFQCPRTDKKEGFCAIYGCYHIYWVRKEM